MRVSDSRTRNGFRKIGSPNYNSPQKPRATATSLHTFSRLSMTSKSFSLEIITPCFCAGADPAKAEIRAPSIRGQLRWWFRVLGGFKALPGDVRSQEALVFGSVADDLGRAGQLITRVANTNLQTSVKDCAQLGHQPFSASAYLTFPIQSRTRNGQTTEYNGRGVIDSGTFELQTIWKGNPEFSSSIEALISIFGNLGSLGFRGRRAMGALAFGSQPPMPLVESLKFFHKADSLIIKKMAAGSPSDAISKLGAWLKSCRAHGRTGQNATENQSPYFSYAKRDHDIGYGIADNQTAFRPALGLPIIQRTQRGENNWELSSQAPKGRFASPVLLRPHRLQNQYWGLVIFVESRKWPKETPAYMGRQQVAVSLDLYEAMKNDTILEPF